MSLSKSRSPYLGIESRTPGKVCNNPALASPDLITQSDKFLVPVTAVSHTKFERQTDCQLAQKRDCKFELEYWLYKKPVNIPILER